MRSWLSYWWPQHAIAPDQPQRFIEQDGRMHLRPAKAASSPALSRKPNRKIRRPHAASIAIFSPDARTLPRTHRRSRLVIRFPSVFQCAERAQHED